MAVVLQVLVVQVQEQSDGESRCAERLEAANPLFVETKTGSGVVSSNRQGGVGMRRRFLIAIMVAAVIATIGCTALRPFAPSTQSVDWQELTNQWGAWATSSGPSVGTQLFQSETDVETWTKQYGQRIPTEGVDFSKDTVVVIVRDIPHAAPVVRAVILDGGKLRIKLTSRLVGAPSIPPGAEMRRFVALRLPKVDVLPVDEEVE